MHASFFRASYWAATGASLLLLLAAPTRAEIDDGKPPPKALLAYIATPEHRQAVIDAAKRFEARLPYACATMAFTPTGRIRSNTTKLDDHGALAKGAWVEAVDGTGCGRTTHDNVLTLLSPHQPPKTINLLPGETHADPVLERDVLPHAFSAAQRLVKDCARLGVIDTRYVGPEGDANPKAKAGPTVRPWRESWTVWACGTLVEVPIHFLPDDTGTTIRTIESEVRLLR